MKYFIFISCLIVFISSCRSSNKIKLNDNETRFTEFPLTDSLHFMTISTDILDVPSKIIKYHDYLIVNSVNREKSKWIIIYSLQESRIIRKVIDYGKGPDEMLSCRIGHKGEYIWLYDMTKKELGIVSIDSLLYSNNLHIPKYPIDRYYYSVSLLNDSIMLGTNDLTDSFKISVVNLKSGHTQGKGSYIMLSKHSPLATLIDACNCHIIIHPNGEKIALSYLYTDVLEIYDEAINLIKVLHGPHIFDIEFKPASRNGFHFMAKNRRTKRAFLNSYSTDKFIFLTFSGHKRSETGWSTSKYILIYSWDGEPLKSLYLESPISAFCVDEDQREIYSYSLTTGELIKARYEI